MKRKIRNILIRVAAVLVVAYFGSGLLIHAWVAHARGTCGEHAVNRPERKRRLTMKRVRIATTLLLLMLLASAVTLRAQGSPACPETPASGSGRLLFIENAGQFDPAARFQVWGGAGTVWLAEDAIWLTVVEPGDRDQGSGDRSQASGVRGQEMGRFSDAPDDPSAVRGSAPQRAVNLKLSFPGANPQPLLEPFDRQETHVSYFIGNNPARWRADVPVWGGVRYRDLYPGLDLEIFRRGRAVVVAAGPQSEIRNSQSACHPARRGHGRGGGG